jgi:uncharacterized protein YdhG (YjbR/CyaY superfamily)
LNHENAARGGAEADMQRDAKSPNAYRSDVGDEQRELLEAIREVIFEVHPEVVEGVRYGMLDYPGLANLAAQKQYVSLYIVPEVLGDYAQEFAGVSRGKSCLRFKRTDQIDRPRLRRLLRDVRRYRKRNDPT